MLCGGGRAVEQADAAVEARQNGASELIPVVGPTCDNLGAVDGEAFVGGHCQSRKGTSMPTWAETWRFRRTWRDVLLGVLGTSWRGRVSYPR
jgi:hypothetical protein